MGDQLDLLITGANGQLGRAILELAAARGLTTLATDIGEMDFTDAGAVDTVVGSSGPRWIFHCGALTNVDGCETDPALAMQVNGAGTENMVRAAKDIDATLVYVSTDFVFDGMASEPYREDAPVAPLSEYGRSKAAGERAVLEAGEDRFYVCRTSWVFGPGGQNFPRAILNRARDGGPLKVVDDQVGRPTYTLDLAEAMLDLAASDAPGGVYHSSNEGQCSWHRFACDLVEAAGLSVPVDTMSSRELDRPAPRPAWSVLDNSKLAAVRGKTFPDYKDAIPRYLAAEEQQS